MPFQEKDMAPSMESERSALSSGVREINKTTLREFIVECFNLDEFKLLCDDLGVKFDSLPGETIEGKANALVNRMWRHFSMQGLQNLVCALKEQRSIPWRNWFREKTESSSSPPDKLGPTNKPLPWGTIVKPETGEVVSGWLLLALRDPIWQGIAGVIAILAFLVTIYQLILAPLWIKPTPIAMVTPSWTPSFIATPTVFLRPTAILTPNPSATPSPTHTSTPAPSPTSTPWVLANAKVYPMEGAQCITEVTGSDPTRPGMIKIMFDTTNKGSWCTWVINLGRFDASQKTHLAFWVKGEKGGERFDVGIKDATTLSGNEPKMEQTTSTEWRRVLIPLRDMQNIKQQDLSALENFSLGFTDKLGSGIIYVQGFVFEP